MSKAKDLTAYRDACVKELKEKSHFGYFTEVNMIRLKDAIKILNEEHDKLNK